MGLAGVVPFLVERNLVPSSVVVDGDPRAPRVEVREYTRRNRNHKVVLPGGAGLLVKQAMEATPEFTDGLRREAAVLRAIARAPALRTLRAWTPTFVAFDRASSILVTRLVHPATTLLRYHQTAGTLPEASAVTVARILRVVHGARVAGTLRGVARDEPPLWRTPPALTRRALAEPAAAELLAWLEDAPFRRDLRALRREWREQDALVHTDPRMENFLLTHGKSPVAGALAVRLVDWELARVGDPAWDVAYVLCDALRFCLLERLPFDHAHAWAAAFVAAYAPRRERARWRARVLAHAPHAMALVAYEALPLAHARPDVMRSAMGMATAVDADAWWGARAWT